MLQLGFNYFRDIDKKMERRASGFESVSASSTNSSALALRYLPQPPALPPVSAEA